jgi:hypothetical protein
MSKLTVKTTESVHNRRHLWFWRGLLGLTILSSATGILLLELPVEIWLLPNYYTGEDGPRRFYQDNLVVLPGDSVEVNLGIESLDGDIEINTPRASTPGYSIADVGHSGDRSTDITIVDPAGPTYTSTSISQGSGAITFRLPPDDGLFGKILPVHYTANISRPMPVGDGQHFKWEYETIEGAVNVAVAEKRQAHELAIFYGIRAVIWVLFAGCAAVWLMRLIRDWFVRYVAPVW